jgi:hypothetical protein
MLPHELVDDFMERWKGKNLQDMDTISSKIVEDTPSDPIKELKEIILNMLNNPNELANNPPRVNPYELANNPRRQFGSRG